jgi:hypothetical protein
MIEKGELIQVIKESVAEVDIETYNVSCIDVAGNILDQIENFGALAGITPDDIVIKGIPTEKLTEYRHVWVELEGEPIDPDRDANTEAGKRIRDVIAQAESDNNIQIITPGHFRVMIS